MKNTARLVLIACILATVSCAHLQPALSPNAKADRESAILFGRFNIGDTFSYQSKLALWLENADTGRRIYIFFDQDEPLYGIRVEPGRYRLAGFLALNRLHQIKGRRELPRAARAFTADAGSLIYLGDFAGEVKVSHGDMLITWRLKSCTNNFPATTVAFREKYPKLASSPAVSIFDNEIPIRELEKLN